MNNKQTYTKEEVEKLLIKMAKTASFAGSSFTTKMMNKCIKDYLK